MTQITFPFLTAYDPPGSSEGTLDPLGLYQIADQLAVQLVPAVRERMQRIRFLTAMAIGALVTEDLEDNNRYRDSSPFLVWEWLVVESIIRTMGDDDTIWGVPGTLVARRAINHQHGYLDARSYLKTPRIFGFNGVYKRLAVRLGVVDLHLGVGNNTEKLADSWARSMGYGNLQGARSILSRWTTAVKRCLNEKPPRTNPGWSTGQWSELAGSFAPASCKGAEKRYLKQLLLSDNGSRLGALPDIWALQDKIADDEYGEERIHGILEKRRPEYSHLLRAIRAYEGFARSLQDGFDCIRKAAARSDTQGFAVADIAKDAAYKEAIKGLHNRFSTVMGLLGEVVAGRSTPQSLFMDRFEPFADRLSPGECAVQLCAHHEKVQRGKSAEGKRSWFDRIDKDRIYLRHQYRKVEESPGSEYYVHEYRGLPIRRFYKDLA